MAEVMTEAAKPETVKPRIIKWYRCPVSREDLRRLSQRSDFLGLVQTLGFLSIFAGTMSAALYSFYHWPVYVTIALVYLHGMVAAFLVNGMHELVHYAVFRSAWLNAFFLRVLSFLGWHNFQMFDASHNRHHAFTLHAPDDLEVVLPQKDIWRNYFKYSFINIRGPYYVVKDLIRIGRGKFRGEWELTLFPPSATAKRRAAQRWAWTLLIGHAAIFAAALYFHLWLVPVLFTFGVFYGSWLQSLCNNTQHVGLQDKVPDFRLCCRTFYLNPVLGVLYWHMNYHTEHHMYPTVPCYRLGQLHALIRNDMPKCTNGLIATWREINPILRRQAEDPTYQYAPELPTPKLA